MSTSSTRRSVLSTTSSTSVSRSLTIRDRGVHPLLKAVRSIYRAQHRKPQMEPVCVGWIERFVRAHPTTPIGRLSSLHVEAFLAALEARGESDERRTQAREALRFLQTEVLRQF
jgi:ElaB/YqjD/DUF883 family membrane-anchored ribosome-binding protein